MFRVEETFQLELEVKEGTHQWAERKTGLLRRQKNVPSPQTSRPSVLEPRDMLLFLEKRTSKFNKDCRP